MNLKKAKQLNCFQLYLLRQNLPYLLEYRERRELLGALATAGLIAVAALLLAYLPGVW